jgi:PKD repeat protein
MKINNTTRNLPIPINQGRSFPMFSSLIVLLFLIFVLSTALAKAQCNVTASNDTSICAGNPVTLKAFASNGTPPYSYIWTSLPPGTYPSAASITVSPSVTTTYKVTIGDAPGPPPCASFDNVVITVNQLPSPVITGSNGCANSTTNHSTPNINGHTYFWTVTGGAITAGQNTSAIIVTWGGAGTGTISVTETNSATGCSKTVSKNNVIIHNLPIADFTPPPPSTFGCSSIPINFYDASTSSDGIINQWNWNFGNGPFPNNTSTLQNPSHSFSAFGTGSQLFNIQLVATTNFGCKSTIVHSLTVNRSPDPSIDDANPILADRWRHCVGAGGPNVTLFINNTSTTSVSNTHYHIDWSDPNNPTPFDSIALPNGTYHTYTSIDNFSVILTVTNNQCTSTKTYYFFNGSNPKGNINSPGNTTGHCNLPDTICFTFTPNVRNNPPGTIYDITFDDATSESYTQSDLPDTICHVYNQTSCNHLSQWGTQNSFGIKCYAHNPCGFNNMILDPIQISTRPTTDFSITPIKTDSSSCANTNISFAALSTSTGYVDPNTGDCSITMTHSWSIIPAVGWALVGASTLTSPIMTLQFTIPGNYSITLSSTNGCGGAIITRHICISQIPISLFSLLPSSGCVPLTVNTTNSSTATDVCGPVTYSWRISNYAAFIDCPSTSSYTITDIHDPTPDFSFLNPGTYTVRLTVTDNCDSSFSIQTVTVKAPPKATITSSHFACEGECYAPTANFADCSDPITSWSWDFSANGTPINSVLASPGCVTFDTPSVNTLSVSATNICGTSPIVPFSVTVDPTPVATITAIDVSDPNACIGSSCLNKYRYTTQANMTNYSWSVPGGTICSGGGIAENFIEVYWNTTGPKTITVTYNTLHNCHAMPAVHIVNVNPGATPSIIAPFPNNVCVGGPSVTYTTQAGMSNYVWSVTGGTFGTPNGLNQIQVAWATAGVGTICVNYSAANGCPAGSPACENITVHALPLPNISVVSPGPVTPCVGNIVDYETGPLMTNYTWSMPGGGGAITGGQGTYRVSVRWDTQGSHQICVTYTDGNSCSPLTPTCLIVNVISLPVPIINATTTTACVGSNCAYQYTTSSGMSSYFWNISGGGTICSGQGTNNIFVTWNASGAQWVNVSYTQSGCPAASPTVFPVPVHDRPIPTITPCTAAVSGGSTITYTTQPANFNYNWTYSGGTLLGGGTSADYTATIKWNTAGSGNVCVNYENSFQCDGINPACCYFTINTVPLAHHIVCGGSFCEGTAGTTIGLDDSDDGILYELYHLGGQLNPNITYTGTPLGGSFNFPGLYNQTGPYTVKATNLINGESIWMLGQCNLNEYPNPTQFSITPAYIQNHYCAGTVTIGTSGSESDVKYWLMFGGVLPNIATDPYIQGTGSPLAFGEPTVAGYYQIYAVKDTTDCALILPGMIWIEANPHKYNFLPAGDYCEGEVSNFYLDGYQTGFLYKLHEIGLDNWYGPFYGNPITGQVDFGPITIPGVYDVYAYDIVNIALTFCPSIMKDTITIHSIPSQSPVISPTGPQCEGIDVQLQSSEPGIWYHLYRMQTPTIQYEPPFSSLQGTGIILNFGSPTAEGLYRILAVNRISPSDSCSIWLPGNIDLCKRPLEKYLFPTGHVCRISTIDILNSQSGITYYLKKDGAQYQSIIGSPVTFTPTAPLTYFEPGTYTVMAVSACAPFSCDHLMTQSVIVDPYPTVSAGNDTIICAEPATTIELKGKATNYDVNPAKILWEDIGIPGTILFPNSLVTDYIPGSTPGQRILKLTVYGNDGCGSYYESDEKIIDVYTIPTVEAGNNESICYSETWQLSGAIGGSATGAIWTASGDGTFNNPASLTAIYTPGPGDKISGSVILKLCTTNASPCLDVCDSMKLIIYGTFLAGNASADQTICAGDIPIALSAIPPTGGSGNPNLTYQWEYFNGSIWVNATAGSGATTLTYNTGPVSVSTRFRLRQADTYCTPPQVRWTNEVLININNVYGGSIGLDQTLCETGDPATINSIIDGSGDGIITYRWEKSVSPFALWTIIGGAISANYDPPPGLTEDTKYRRITISTNNSVPCEAPGNVVTVSINPLPTMSVSGNTTICENDATGIQISLTGTPPWSVSYNDGSMNHIISNIPASPYTLMVSPSITTSYAFISVTDGNSCTNPALAGTILINVNPTPQNFILTATSNGSFCEGSAGLELNLSGSHTSISYQLMIGLMLYGNAVAGTGSPISFGIVNQPGNYSVVATNNLTTCHVQSNTVAVTVTPLPDIEFTAANACMHSPTSFILSGTNLVSIVNCVWNFGDGVISTYVGATNVTHTYPTSGTYLVTLTATDDHGCVKVLNHNVIVTAIPVSLFSWDTPTCQGSSVTFHNHSYTTVPDYIVNWLWEFGDGNSVSFNWPGAPQSATHTYASPQTYFVKLTVTTILGCIRDTTLQITISPKPVANFYPLSACQDNAVTFHDNSQNNGGGSITGWNWTFDDPTSGVNNYSDLQNPSHIFASPGSYQVQLTATTINGCSDIVSYQVVVNVKPPVEFNTQNNCQNSEVLFLPNPLVMNIGAIATWNWSFGDGGVSTLQSPSHIYLAIGSFIATLTVTDTSGCINTIAKTVNIVPQPYSDFTSSQPACNLSSIQFTSLASTPAGYIVRWTWNFGDGTSQVVNNIGNPNVSHTYNNYGIYDVSLTIKTNDSCTSTINRTVVVAPKPMANFSDSANCVNNPVEFSDLSQSGTGSLVSWSWDFGDPSTGTANQSSFQNPTHTFSSASNAFTVTLVVTNSSGCIDTKDTIVNLNPIPVFEFTASAGCANDSTHFISTISSGVITNWLWNFGDGTTSTVVEPYHIYSTSGQFTVLLTGTDDNGCHNTRTQTVNISPSPIASFQTSEERCTNSPVLFDELSNASGGQFTSWYWDFGDGTDTLINAPGNPDVSHIYVSSGTFIVRLKVYTNQGCENENQQNISILPGPLSQFHYSTSCEDTTVQFNGIPGTNGGSDIVGYSWNFGDPASGVNNTSLLQNPAHIYVNPGIYQVSLSEVNASGCSDSITQAVTVSPKPAIDYAWINTCHGSATRFTVDTLVANIGAIQLYDWDFGDGSPHSNIQDPLHTYVLIGSYSVKLSITDSTGCRNVKMHEITISPLPFAQFTYVNNCADTAVSFHDASNIAVGTITGYSWSFGDPGSGPDNTSPMQNPTHTFAIPGIYNVSLKVTSQEGCEDSLMLPVQVFTKPTANFSFTTNCDNGAVFFQDSSFSQQASITSWFWEFEPNQFGTGQNPYHVYFAADSCYDVSLTVLDTRGCANTKVKEVCVPASLTADFITAATCFGDSTTFSPVLVAPGNDSLVFFKWNFDDFNSGIYNISTLRNPYHIFTDPGTYKISLDVTDIHNCTYQMYKNISVHPLPLSSFTYTGGICDSLITFSKPVSGGGSNIISWYWEFGDGTDTLFTTTHPDSLGHKYPSPGFYPVTLSVMNTNGCSNNFETDSVLVKPCILAAFDTTGKLFCQNTSVLFSDNSSGGLTISEWRWDFGDGNDTTYFIRANTINHLYKLPGIKTVTMQVSGSIGTNIITDIYSMVIVVKPSPLSEFKVQSACIGEAVQFTNLSSGIDSINYSYKLIFDPVHYPGITAQLPDTAYNYVSSGEYWPQLIAMNTMGCTDTATHQVSVFALPVVDISVENPCIGRPSKFDGGVNTAVNRWDWSITSINDNGYWIIDSLQNPEITFDKIGEYVAHLSVIDVNGCKKTDSLQFETLLSPKSDFSFVENIEGEKWQINITNQSQPEDVHYKWYFEGGTPPTSKEKNPTVSYASEEDDSLAIKLITIIGSNLCADTLLKTYHMVHRGLYIPTAFWPDDPTSTMNVFQPKGEGLKDFKINVFDRWGNKLWESTTEQLIDGHPGPGWDGRYKNKYVPSGIYVWKATAVFSDGSVWNGVSLGNNKDLSGNKYGTITLIR